MCFHEVEGMLSNAVSIGSLLGAIGSLVVSGILFNRALIARELQTHFNELEIQVKEHDIELLIRQLQQGFLAELTWAPRVKMITLFKLQ